MRRPTGVTVTTGLMCLSLVLGVVVALTQPMPAAANSPIDPAKMAGIVHAMVAFGTLLSAVFVLFYYLGHNWARWLVIADSVLQLLMVVRIGKAWHTSHISAALVVGNALLAIFLLWYLFQPAVKAWFAPEPAPSALPPYPPAAPVA